MAFAAITHEVELVETHAAASRTTTGGDAGGASYAGTGIDLTKYTDTLVAYVSAGTVGTSLNGKWQESDDNSTFSDVSGGAMTALTSAGNRTVELSVRKFTKRYASFQLTVGGTCVCSTVVLRKPRVQ